MVLKREDKTKMVAELTEVLRSAPAAVVVAFRALTMAESSELRRALRPAGGGVRVVPKRLFRRVLNELKWPASFAETSNSIAIAWTGGPAGPPAWKRGGSGGKDLLAPAKAVRQYAKAAASAQILGGLLEGRVLSGGDVEQLADLPPLEVLRGQVVGALAGPARGLVGVLSAVLRGLPGVLQAKARL